MPRSLLRIVIIFLIPGVILDAGMAPGFCTTTPLPTKAVHAIHHVQLFEADALSVAALWMLLSEQPLPAAGVRVSVAKSAATEWLERLPPKPKSGEQSEPVLAIRPGTYLARRFDRLLKEIERARLRGDTIGEEKVKAKFIALIKD